MKAAALADDRISCAADISIQNFRGGRTPMTMAKIPFGGDIPDVIGFSVMGRNYRWFGALTPILFPCLDPVIQVAPRKAEEEPAVVPAATTPSRGAAWAPGTDKTNRTARH
jgi:hypothetical protein